MKFLTTETLITGGATVIGGTMTSGPHKGCQEYGTIVVDLPINGHFDAISDTILFSQSPKLYNNLGDCTHFKATGTAYCPTNGGIIGPSPGKSVFGPTYSQEGIGSYVLSRTADAFESYVRLPGNFNNCEEGDWYFGLAARRVGNCIESIWGNADLDGSYVYRGYYTFSVVEYDIVNGQWYRRSTGTCYHPDYLTTRQMRPFEAMDSCSEEIYSKLRRSKWYECSDKFYAAVSIPHPSSLNLTPQQVFPDMGVDWGELAADAYSSVPFFKGNGIAYTEDIINLRKDAMSTLSLLTSLAKGGQLAKKAASLFLSFYYGWRLTIKDSEELVSAYEKAASLRSNRCRCTSQRTWVAHDATYMATLQCYYRRYGKASKLDQFIIDNDLALTPENLWDLVPFSFVVDWFTGIGSVLEDASNYFTFVQKHEVICTGRSIKATKCISARQLSSRYAGSINISYYHRKYTSGPISPTFHLSNSVNPLDHAIEGTALIVSRR